MAQRYIWGQYLSGKHPKTTKKIILKLKQKEQHFKSTLNIFPKIVAVKQSEVGVCKKNIFPLHLMALLINLGIENVQCLWCVVALRQCGNLHIV